MGLFGRSNTEKTNASNEYVARMTNETNLQLAREQNEWNLAQWNRENAYNSPASQLQRYQEAGINPMYAGLDSGAASQLQSADMANQQPYQFQAGERRFDEIMRTIGAMSDAFSNIQESQLRQQQITANSYDLATRRINNEFELESQGATLYRTLVSNGMPMFQANKLVGDISKRSHDYGNTGASDMVFHPDFMNAYQGSKKLGYELEQIAAGKDYWSSNARYENTIKQRQAEDYLKKWANYDSALSRQKMLDKRTEELNYYYDQIKKDIDGSWLPRYAKTTLKIELLKSIYSQNSLGQTLLNKF